jgi:hypothetical protein
VTGTLHSQPNATFTVDFYASATADPSGFGQGQQWLGAIQVTTDRAGDAQFDARLSATPRGAVVSATATDAVGNTSEFSFAPHGHVVAHVSHGRLEIAGLGDSAVRIAQGPSGPNSIEVTSGDGTRIFDHVTRGIDVDMWFGHAAVFLDGSGQPLTISGGLDIHAGSGSTALWLNHITVQGQTRVATGRGDDYIALLDSIFSGAIDIATHGGNDSIVIARSLFMRDVTLAAGAGNDRILVDANPNAQGPASVFQGPVDIRLGRGDDRVVLGSEPSFEQPPNPVQFLDLLRVNGGPGNDSLSGLDVSAPNRQITNVEDVFFADSGPGGP